jgi:hypothetical protein
VRYAIAQISQPLHHSKSLNMRSIKLLPILILLLSCSSSKKIIRFQKSPDEIYVNDNLKEFFKSNKTPNIVLRVPNNNDKATSNTITSKDNNVLYNAIEKELLKQGFSVRDRGLFNELLSKSQTTDYSKIKDLTNTDVILEVVNIDPAVIYTTNKVTITTKKKEKTQIGTVDYKKYGASVEFRIIMVRNNEIAGSYKYNYQPCPGGCEIGSFNFSGKRANQQVVLKETVSVNTLEEFIKLCTQDLIRSFRS